VDLRRLLPGWGRAGQGFGDERSKAGSGAAALGRRWSMRRTSTWFLPWWRDPSQRVAGPAAGGGGNLTVVVPAPWAARPDLVAPTIPYHHSFPVSLMGVGVGDIVGGSVDWGDHFFRRRWSAGLGWLGGSRSIF
jgi:hypothetical protein